MRLKGVLWVGLFILALGSTGFAQGPPPAGDPGAQPEKQLVKDESGVTPIHEIIKDPRTYANETLLISGYVVGVAEERDSTADFILQGRMLIPGTSTPYTIKVITSYEDKSELPEPGKFVTLKGMVLVEDTDPDNPMFVLNSIVDGKGTPWLLIAALALVAAVLVALIVILVKSMRKPPAPVHESVEVSRQMEPGFRERYVDDTQVSQPPPPAPKPWRDDDTAIGLPGRFQVEKGNPGVGEIRLQQRSGQGPNTVRKIGRASSFVDAKWDIVFPEDLMTVSKEHAEITHDNGKYTLRNTSTKQYVHINDSPLPYMESRVLEDGDRIKFGPDAILRYYARDN